MIQSFNNKTEKVGDDLKKSIKKGSKVDIAASIFSIFGYESLKSELNKCEQIRFIFTDPTFIEVDKNRRQRKQFEINSNNIKKAISGSIFELNLKNELKGKAIAKECKKWIEQKVTFKTNVGHKYIQPHLTLDNTESKFVYTGMGEFSSAGIGYEKDNTILNQIIKTDDFEMTKQYFNSFEEIWNDPKILRDVTDEVVDYIADLYRDAVLGIINKLERYNGCILADSVGLGKTFSALGVIKYYQERNRTILVLCPKKLGDNWQTFLNNYDDNPLIKDRLNYNVLYHTDLSREKGYSNGIDLSRINWGNYDLVVIDESHNFRNNDPRKDKMTRYQKLLKHVMKAGVKTKVLMLSLLLLIIGLLI